MRYIVTDMERKESFTHFKTRYPLTQLAVLLFILLSADLLQAQDWRASLGYSVQRYGLDITPNSGYINDIGFTQKGVVTAELERYLVYRFYMSLQGDYLVHNQESIFFDGPINFNHSTITANLGFQGKRLGIYGGGHLGNIWNLKFKDGQTASEEQTHWIEPQEHSNTWTAGYQFGVKYYLLSFVRLQAEFRNTSYLNNGFQSQNMNGQTAQAASIDFMPNSFTVGVSISIPWRSRSRLERINDRDRLPALMELRGVNFSSPMSGDALVTSTFGQRWGRNHEGVDLDANRGDDVLAAASGVVIEAGRSGSYGNIVVIRHGSSYTTHYAHLQRIRVREGQTVRRGQVIGTAGDSGVATGIHLHFEIRQNGTPLDPQRYIRF